jgi:pSer/pThr/pTyr-binding forkhead associated (FHA) protein
MQERVTSDRGIQERSFAERGFSDRGVEARPEPVGVPLGTDSTHASPGVHAPAVQAPRARSGDAHQNPGSNGAAPYVACPQCDHQNPATNRFCASCGYKLNLSSVPAKPGVAAQPISGTVMLTALRADGSEAGSYTLTQSPSETIGRDTGSIFAGDSYLSPRHATFTRKSERLFVSDARSLNGVYLKIRPNSPWPLRFGDIFRIGQEILRLEKLEAPQPSPDGVQRLGSPADGYVARLGLVIGRDTTGNAFPVPKQGLHLGRERGDVLFPEDGYVSGLHCRLGVSGLTDLGSSNGSFVRLRDEHPLSSGDILLMGQQLFRVDS